jgi:ABC-type branched-subunit amino acid transport system ATPase component
MTAAPLDLSVRHLTVRFGGVTAVDDVTLEAPAGRITGLIGPNGAGKTTMFNACCGTVPSDGQVTLGDTPISGLGPAVRARRGLGRTFQRIELCDGLTVLDNVALGVECVDVGWQPWTQVFSRPGQRETILARSLQALDRCGLIDEQAIPCRDLSTGRRRFVELARALAADFSVLLLDEPSSGLDTNETMQFAAILSAVAAERGIGMLIVEHDMSLVRAICEYTWVLDFGRQVADGPTNEVLASPVVRAAYLGADAR